MRKKLFAVFLCAITLTLGMVGVASATLIDFAIDEDKSSVDFDNVDTWGFYGSSSIVVDLADGLGDESFSLSDGQSYTLDFFDITINAEGFLSGGTADIQATLAFSSPFLSDVTSTGDGGWFTIAGFISGGYLSWLDMPQILTLDNGNYFDVDFEDIRVLGLGNSTTVTATVTAHAATPVPEPATMLLLGIGLIGLSGFGRNKFPKR
jgi:hypothetical protein